MKIFVILLILTISSAVIYAATTKEPERKSPSNPKSNAPANDSKSSAVNRSKAKSGAQPSKGVSPSSPNSKPNQVQNQSQNQVNSKAQAKAKASPPRGKGNEQESNKSPSTPASNDGSATTKRKSHLVPLRSG